MYAQGAGTGGTPNAQNGKNDKVLDASSQAGALRVQQDQAWYQSHKETAKQAQTQLANNGGMSGRQFGRKPSVPQYIGNTSNNNSTSGTSGTSGTNGKNSYSGRPTTTYDPTAQLNAFYAQQQAAAEEAARRQAEILQQQYERQKAAEAEARAKQEAAALAGYNSLLDAAKGSYDSALTLRDEGYNKATGDVNSATERAMQQAYIANQMQNRNLGQQLAAMGRSGGASESTMLGLANEYGNARGELDLSRNDQLATLAAQLAEGKASDLDAYNQAKAAYDKDYQDRLADLAAASLDRLLNYDNTYTSGLTQIEQSKAQTLAQIQAAQNQALMEAQQALAEQQAAALYKTYGNDEGGSGGTSGGGGADAAPAADDTEQQARLSAQARARYEAEKDAQAEERLTGVPRGTEMAPTSFWNRFLTNYRYAMQNQQPQYGLPL